ncbi:reverse transcriptase family protein [Niveispirillum lacus]|uniref:reverse transcriptase family protein n=1 Tax=Niveispirillum lacus TaxID=1981099 RepID=UPI0013FDBAF4|nr:reverse transcriptase family protein [Niveispirillum lacus]
MGDAAGGEEVAEIGRLSAAGLPPITSLNALSVMTGYNPGFVWALANRTARYYRVFEIPKGRGTRQIEAPRVALKLIQKWLCHHFSAKWQPLDAVHGFVPGRSHLTAASVHLRAEWILSIDLENFFPSTPIDQIRGSLRKLGYQDGDGLELIANLLSFRGRLSQGAPTSPVISNIALSDIDGILSDIARNFRIRFTRYADDITFSGISGVQLPDELLASVREQFVGTPWRISERKIHIAKSPARLKVHGLLVHGDELRLTKGYRNRLRAYRHLMQLGRIDASDLGKVTGHMNYASQIERLKS